MVHGQPTYNGVAFLLKAEATEVENRLLEGDPESRFLALTAFGIRWVNVYVPNGAGLDSPKYPYKLAWLEGLRETLKKEKKRAEPLVVLGDFNIAPEDRDVHEPMLWENSVLTSPEVRSSFQGLLELGLLDVFRAKNPEIQAFSWWDYRQAAFRRNQGLRIDHILASKALALSTERCFVDKGPRSWNVRPIMPR